MIRDLRNLFTVADLAKCGLTAKLLYRAPVPERDGYFEENFEIDRQLTNRKVDFLRLRGKAAVRFCQKAIGWAWRRLPLHRSADEEAWAISRLTT